MSWLQAAEFPLEISIDRVREGFPEAPDVASFSATGRTWLVARPDLDDMIRMGLGHLPLAVIALPYEEADVLKRPHRETLVRDVSHHLCDYFPNFFVAALYEMQSLFIAQQVEAFIIGGIVRDMLLSSDKRFDIQDVDIAVEGDALAAVRYIVEHSRNFRAGAEFPQFGTAKMQYKEQLELDAASTRAEIYTACGALPEVVARGVDLMDDLIRRDFTVNALALSLTKPGQVVDGVGGLPDLENKLIRVLKAPSFFEDPSRIFRALRFAERLNFAWAEDTVHLLDQFMAHVGSLYKGGGERIQYELAKFFCHPESASKTRWMDFFIEKKLYRLIDTQITESVTLAIPLSLAAERLEIIAEGLGDFWRPDCRWESYLALIFMGLPEARLMPACHRLGLNKAEIEAMVQSQSLIRENPIAALGPGAPAVTLYERFHGLTMTAAYVGILLSHDFDASLAAYLRYRRLLAPITLEVTGDDILRMGVPQGAQVGQWLKALLYAKLDGQVADRLDELDWLKTHLSGPTP